MRDSIKRYADAGITTIVHADGDWLPMLPYFNELPRGCCHFVLAKLFMWAGDHAHMVNALV